MHVPSSSWCFKTSHAYLMGDLTQIKFPMFFAFLWIQNAKIPSHSVELCIAYFNSNSYLSFPLPLNIPTRWSRPQMEDLLAGLEHMSILFFQNDLMTVLVIPITVEILRNYSHSRQRLLLARWKLMQMSNVNKFEIHKCSNLVPEHSGVKQSAAMYV